MPIIPFEGDTFIAYLDISGFKKMMDDESALKALNSFYGNGYDILHSRKGKKPRIEGFFFSDSALLFARDTEDKKKSLPYEIKNCLSSSSCNQENGILKFVENRDGDAKHFHFYWMVNNSSEISNFEKQYKEACKLKSDLKYKKILRVLKGCVNCNENA